MPRPKIKLYNGFTLVEILIVVAIMALLSIMIFYGNIQSSFQKARDSKRKQDLSKITSLLEDYYNDNQVYPAGNPADGTIDGAPWGGPFGSYAPSLPQDPQSPVTTYFYQAIGNRRFYALYAKLENKKDTEIERTGCKNGCGPDLAYNYAVFSSSVVMIAGVPNGDALPMGPTAIPTPTFNPVPPPDPNTPCADNQCCKNHTCGSLPPYTPWSPGNPATGDGCTSVNNKCVHDNIYGWECLQDTTNCP